MLLWFNAGATAVLLGRPVFFSLAVGGEDGVVRMLSIIREELEAAMALCGCQVCYVSCVKSAFVPLPCRQPPLTPDFYTWYNCDILS